MNLENLNSAPLGKKSTYVQQYDAGLLFPIPRKGKRDEIEVPVCLPFKGHDIWNAFEVSWLNGKGKPEVAIAEFLIPCESPNIVESKSFKLYLNSFNGTRFPSYESVREVLLNDISEAVGAKVLVRLMCLSEVDERIGTFEGKCLDSLDIECNEYQPNPQLLMTSDYILEETVYSHLLKSNCLVTGQPDWGSVLIRYQGKQIDHAGLLKYIVSLRDHNEFHEQCVERIFMDISRRCSPEKLTVYARYTRRGGLDINPLRTSDSSLDLGDSSLGNLRLARQ